MALAAAILSGCTTTTIGEPEPPSTTAPPVFASDEEALAAAQAAYEEFARVSDAIAKAGGDSEELLRPLVTSAEYERELQSFDGMRAGSLTSVGEITTYAVRLQDADLQTGEVSVYLCLDLSKSRLTNAAGEDVTPSTRIDQQPFVVSFLHKSGKLLVDSHQSWQKDNFC
jgi:hypothetical protein